MGIEILDPLHPADRRRDREYRVRRQNCASRLLAGLRADRPRGDDSQLLEGAGIGSDRRPRRPVGEERAVGIAARGQDGDVARQVERTGVGRRLKVLACQAGRPGRHGGAHAHDGHGEEHQVGSTRGPTEDMRHAVRDRVQSHLCLLGHDRDTARRRGEKHTGDLTCGQELHGLLLVGHGPR